MSLRIFNTLTDRKEEIDPIEPGRIGMYVCGVTVYDMCHIGHARAYVTADVIYRTLLHAGLDVTYVRNFTDLDDKIIVRANELGIDCRELSDRYIREFYTDMDALGIRRPQLEPRVTDHIPDIIRTVEQLIERGHAYVDGGDVFFDVPSFPDYGKLSRRPLDDAMCGARVAVDERKKCPLDFVLWKASKEGEPAWDSPWGMGRPGWHIECSTMSTKYLGDTFDIHGGGKDLIFPHHENEIAQAEAATGKPFSRVFFHNGFVNIDKEKMSKSLGNFFTIREIANRYDPEALRYFLLTTHYRSPINFEVDFVCPHCRAPIARAHVEARACPGCGKTFDEAEAAAAVHFPALEEASCRLEYLYATIDRMGETLDKRATGVGDLIRAEEIEAIKPRFVEAIEDDFNAAAALGVLSDAMRLANEVMDNKEDRPEGMITSSIQALSMAIGEICEVLGLLDREPSKALESIRGCAMRARGVIEAEIGHLVQERADARAAKDFARADAVRDQLHEMGVELMDSPQGTTWKIRR
ncbi:MAG: cysteine--tRNA ligase [Deltaproteobacteria bacterium]|nr:cysteine--tRNA ligase [Deltaproteobacteria bacterium]